MKKTTKRFRVMGVTRSEHYQRQQQELKRHTRRVIGTFILLISLAMLAIILDLR